MWKSLHFVLQEIHFNEWPFCTVPQWLLAFEGGEHMEVFYDHVRWESVNMLALQVEDNSNFVHSLHKLAKKILVFYIVQVLAVCSLCTRTCVRVSLLVGDSIIYTWLCAALTLKLRFLFLNRRGGCTSTCCCTRGRMHSRWVRLVYAVFGLVYAVIYQLRIPIVWPWFLLLFWWRISYEITECCAVALLCQYNALREASAKFFLKDISFVVPAQLLEASEILQSLVLLTYPRWDTVFWNKRNLSSAALCDLTRFWRLLQTTVLWFVVFQEEKHEKDEKSPEGLESKTASFSNLTTQNLKMFNQITTSLGIGNTSGANEIGSVV